MALSSPSFSPSPPSSPPANTQKATTEAADEVVHSDPISSTSSHSPTLYVAYGSNLSTTQMDQRCPTSTLLTSPIAVLKDWEWFIAFRGYASIRPAPGKNVYGLLYELDEEAEDLLDMYEGAGVNRKGSYYKESVWVDLLPQPTEGSGDQGVDGNALRGADETDQDGRVKVLVYIDCTNEEGELGDTYASRLKKGVEESAKLGLNVGDSFGKWMDQVMGADKPERHKYERRMLQRESDEFSIFRGQD